MKTVPIYINHQKVGYVRGIQWDMVSEQAYQILVEFDPMEVDYNIKSIRSVGVSFGSRSYEWGIQDAITVNGVAKITGDENNPIAATETIKLTGQLLKVSEMGMTNKGDTDDNKN